MIVGRVYFGKWGSRGSPGEELVVARTDQAVFEVHCHGGNLAPSQVLDNVIDAGGKFLRRPIGSIGRPNTAWRPRPKQR
jgi:hypothetical protein